jgi:hypothetical protein
MSNISMSSTPIKCDNVDCELFDIEFYPDSDEMECGGCNRVYERPATEA